MIDFELDRSVSTPLTEQVCAQVRSAIAGGVLMPGTRLPSSRRLADRLGVSRNTVVGAYERLLADGWVEAGVGRGTFVATVVPRAPSGIGADRLAETASGRDEPKFSWQGALLRATPATSRIATPDGNGGATINLGGAVPGPASFPIDDLRRALGDALERHGAAALGYGPPAGWRPLRAFIAERVRLAGVADIDAGDVLVVGGSQQGLDLIARLLLRPGDGVVTESPTYANALDLWRLHGARVWGVAMDGRGLRPDALATLLDRVRPKLLYLMPSFQNPTGLTMDGARRKAVMAVVRDAHVPVVEDHFDAELRFVGHDQPPLLAYDRAGQVLMLGTFSKILCPGLRLGWIVAPPAVRRRLLELKRITDLASSLPLQMALAELGTSGAFDRHLERVRAGHAARLRTVLAAIAAHLPAEVAVTRPEGGMNLWLTLPAGVSSMEVYQRALAAGVTVAPGRWFFPDPHGDEHGGEHLRLSFVGEPSERLEAGVRILGEVLDRCLQRGSRRQPQPEEATLFV